MDKKTYVIKNDLQLAEETIFYLHYEHAFINERDFNVVNRKKKKTAQEFIELFVESVAPEKACYPLMWLNEKFATLDIKTQSNYEIRHEIKKALNATGELRFAYLTPTKEGGLAPQLRSELIASYDENQGIITTAGGTPKTFKVHRISGVYKPYKWFDSFYSNVSTIKFLKLTLTPKALKKTLFTIEEIDFKSIPEKYIPWDKSNVKAYDQIDAKEKRNKKLRSLSSKPTGSIKPSTYENIEIDSHTLKSPPMIVKVGQELIFETETGQQLSFIFKGIPLAEK